MAEYLKTTRQEAGKDNGARDEKAEAEAEVRARLAHVRTVEAVRRVVKAGKQYDPARPDGTGDSGTSKVRQTEWYTVGETPIRFRELPASTITDNKSGAFVAEILATVQDPLTHLPTQHPVPIAGVNFMAYYRRSDGQGDSGSAWTRGVVAWNELMIGSSDYPQAADVDGPLFQGVQYSVGVVEERIRIEQAAAAQEKAARNLGAAAATPGLTAGDTNVA